MVNLDTCLVPVGGLGEGGPGFGQGRRQIFSPFFSSGMQWSRLSPNGLRYRTRLADPPLELGTRWLGEGGRGSEHSTDQGQGAGRKRKYPTRFFIAFGNLFTIFCYNLKTVNLPLKLTG